MGIIAFPLLMRRTVLSDILDIVFFFHYFSEMIVMKIRILLDQFISVDEGLFFPMRINKSMYKGELVVG